MFVNLTSAEADFFNPNPFKFSSGQQRDASISSLFTLLDLGTLVLSRLLLPASFLTFSETPPFPYLQSWVAEAK